MLERGAEHLQIPGRDGPVAIVRFNHVLDTGLGFGNFGGLNGFVLRRFSH